MSVVAADFIIGSHGQHPQVGQDSEVPITWSQGASDLVCNLHMTRIQNLVFIESGELAGPGGAIITTKVAAPGVTASLLPLAFRPSVERNIPIRVASGNPLVYASGNLKILPTGAMEVGYSLDPVTSTAFPAAACTFNPRGAYSITGHPLPPL